MKIWSLQNKNELIFAVVLADTFEEACEKANKRLGDPCNTEWIGEEFQQGMYDDVLLFL